MRQRSFEKGKRKLMKRGYSEKSAINSMKGLIKKNKNRKNRRKVNKNNYKYNTSNTIYLPPWARYIVAIFIETVLFVYKVPSKEDVQIMLIQTIIPMSDATRPLLGFVTILSIIMQIASLLLIYDLLIKLYKSIEKWIRKHF